MAFDYGYGPLENKLIELFRSGAPDFAAAEELIRQGADINAIGKNDDENILSEILSGYWRSRHADTICDACEDCGDNNCVDCKQGCDLNPNLGPSMCAIIHFFLSHGFNLTNCEGCFGAQCLCALTLSTFDRYMIEATKILLDAGARNRTISPKSTDQHDTPWSSVATEGSYQSDCEHDYGTANIYEAVYQIYQAVEDGNPYSGIDSFEIAIGRKVLSVLTERNDDQTVFFSTNSLEAKEDHCYTQTLYFVYDGGFLVSTRYLDFWTDTVLPNIELEDVSDRFEGIIGNTIRRFTYSPKMAADGTGHCSLPITTIEMDSGYKARFSIYFNEGQQARPVAYYEILKADMKAD